jgi:hypothetical protein
MEDFVFGACLMGDFLAEMGFLLSFLYMTGWVSQYTDLGSAKEICQQVGTFSLIFGNSMGLLIGYMAERTQVVAPFFYVAFILKGIPLIILATMGNNL